MRKPLTSVQHVVDQPRCAVEVVVISGAIVARIVEVWPHPNAHSLWVADIDPGSGWLRRVVHGGCRQLHPGDLVPYAPPGARLSTGKRMRTRTYRGQSSQGMLCSTNELGWTTDGPDAVHVLDHGVPGEVVTPPHPYFKTVGTQQKAGVKSWG